MGHSATASIVYGVCVDSVEFNGNENANELMNSENVDGISFSYHGHCQEIDIILCIDNTEINTVDWGDVKDIDPSKLVADPSWSEKLKKFATDNGIPIVGEVGWKLCAMYG